MGAGTKVTRPGQVFRVEDAAWAVARKYKGATVSWAGAQGLPKPQEESVFYYKWEGKLWETLSRGVTSPDLHYSSLFREGPGRAGVEVKRPMGRGHGDKSWPGRMAFWS